MSRPTILKAVLLAVGLIVFGYGVQADLSEVRWAGIGFLAAAFVLRLVTARAARRDDETREE